MKRIVSTLILIAALALPVLGQGATSVNIYARPNANWLSGSRGVLDPAWEWMKQMDTLVAGSGASGTGQNWYVDSGLTTAGSGSNWANALATVEEAIDAISADSGASRGDWIHVAEGHAETGGDAVIWDADVAGITIKHYGQGSLQGTYTFGHANSTCTIGAANVTVIGGRFLAGITEVVVGLTVEAAGDYFTLVGAEFPEPLASASEFNIGIQLTTGADDVTIIGCTAYSADATGADHWLNGGAGAVNRLTVAGNLVHGEYAIANIFSDQVDLETSLFSNKTTNMTTGQHGIELTAAATGSYGNNSVFTDGYWTAIDPGSLKCIAPNWVATEINESPQMFPHGETDRQFLEILMGREIGAVAGSAEEIKVWWVDGGAGSTGDGKSPAGAFDTIEESLTECSNTIDDWILVQDYSGSTNEITIGNAFVHIIGYGPPGMRYPRIQASTSGEAGFILGDAADNVEIANFIIASTGTAAGIEFTGGAGSFGVWIHDCIFGRSGNTVQDGIEIMSGAAAPHLVVENCRFGQGAPSAVTRDGIRFSGNASWSIVRNNVFRSVDGIGINYASAVSQPMAHDNHFQLVADGVGDAIDVVSSTAGGYFYNNTATFGNGAAVEEVFRDQGSGNEWSGNVGGSVAGSRSCSKTYVNWTAAEHSLFNIKGGPVKVTTLVGIAMVDIKPTGMMMALDLNTTSPSGTVVLATQVEINNDDAGHSYTLNASFGGALVASAPGGLEHVGDPFIAPIGTITFTSGGEDDSGGSIAWYIEYEPLAPGAYIVPATTD